MLIPNHPADERLAAFAADDLEAPEPALAEHVSSCVRCSAVVDDLSTLRIVLAELPDIAPHRPLQLVPGVADPSPAGNSAGGWVRRLFAPALAAGAAIALVGAVGTTTPLLDGMAGGADSAAGEQQFIESMRDPDAPAAAASAGTEAGGQAEFEPGASTARDIAASGDANPLVAGEGDDETRSGTPTGASDLGLGTGTERSPWPMVLFSGVALMIGALLLRWILEPRAG